MIIKTLFILILSNMAQRFIQFKEEKLIKHSMCVSANIEFIGELGPILIQHTSNNDFRKIKMRCRTGFKIVNI